MRAWRWSSPARGISGIDETKGGPLRPPQFHVSPDSLLVFAWTYFTTVTGQ
jgi:hypothetical protein